jgi:uncharacterized protein (TIGR03435 family)
MQELDDITLLAEYVKHDSHAAFAELVNRHINKVYSVALRQTRNPSQAEEITQAVFVILAKKAPTLGKNVFLTGWLYHTARLTAVSYIRSEIRRARREEEAHMQRLANETEPESNPWPQIAPLLDTAIADLSEKDRRALLLRFFDGKSMKEVGTALGGTEDAAKMRVNRAVEKLRHFFTKRGIALSTAALTTVLAANSVQAAPATLATAATALAVAKGVAANTSTVTLIQGAMKLMAFAKAKTAVIIGATALLTVGTTAIVVSQITTPTPTAIVASEPSWADDPKVWANDYDTMMKLPPAFILRPTRFPKGGGGASSNERIVFKTVSLKWLLATAHGQIENRTLLPDDAPQGKFDFMFTESGDFHTALKAEMQKRFGLVGHLEDRDGETLIIKVANTNPPDLRISKGKVTQWIGAQRSNTLKNQSIGPLFRHLERELKTPLVDQTGLTNKYDLTLKWEPRPGQTEADAIKESLLTQLGLELVPDRQQVQMLIIEKAK